MLIYCIIYMSEICVNHSLTNTYINMTKFNSIQSYFEVSDVS